MGIGRVTIALSGTLVALVMVIGMFTIVGDTTTPAVSTMSLYGHYTITVADSDGNIKAYIQADNAPTHLLKDCLFDGYFGQNPGHTDVAVSEYVTACDLTDLDLAVGDGGNLGHAVGDSDLQNRYTASGNGTATVTGQTSSTASDTTVTISHTAAITILQTDLDNSSTGGETVNLDGDCLDEDGDGAEECQIDETGLFDANGQLLSAVDFTKVRVNNGDTVDIDLTITLT